jgi:hypothetical protein
MDINNIDTVDVYVGGDGLEWSCQPAKLYQIPTEVFDENMLIGRLETQEDLQIVLEEVKLNSIGNPNAIIHSYTDIWVSYDGNWSGLPSILYKIPYDVFHYLTRENSPLPTAKTIGRLQYPDDLFKLIINIRKEMQFGFVENLNQIIHTKPMNTEIKKCGHECTTSSVKDGCCNCYDKRPIQEEGTYPQYIDGVGWKEDANRSYGYCPYCSFV